jgi:serine/threonine protein kinase
VDQLNQILQILGTPDDETLRRIGSDRALMYIRSLPRTPKIPWEKLYPRANPQALDLLEKLLKFDPAERITCDEALAHPYLEAYHDPDDEPTHPRMFDFSFESITEMSDLRVMIAKEVVDFKAEKNAAERGQPRIQQPLPVPNRDQVGQVVRDDHDEGL